MWIEELKNGKYKFVERYEDYLTGKIKKVSVTLDKNTAQARKKAQKLLNERIEASQEVKCKKELSMKELVEEYREYQKLSVKESTYTRNFHTCNTLIDLFGSDTIVERMTVNYINKKLLETGKDVGTLNEYLRRFRAMIRWGYKNDLIEDIRFIDKLDNFKDRPHKEKIQEKYLERSELKLLLSKMEQPTWKLLTEFMSLSGLRFGEAAALEKADVDFSAKEIRITKTLDSVNGVVTTPKSMCSIRSVYMQPELFNICKKIQIHMKKEEMINGVRSDLFFHNKNGDHISFFSFNKYLKNLSWNLFGKKITTHALRHTHASLLLEQSVSIDTISRRLGHEDSKVTKEIYLHVTKELEEKDNRQIERINLL